jgi:hypothetical protein
VILFAGDEPSSKSDPDVPFKDAACEGRVKSWINTIVQSETYCLINRVDPDFNIVVSLAVLHDDPIVAFGNNASKALGPLPHYKMPHPSGRNRKINDKVFISVMLEECKKFVQNAKV